MKTWNIKGDLAGSYPSLYRGRSWDSERKSESHVELALCWHPSQPVGLVLAVSVEWLEQRPLELSPCEGVYHKGPRRYNLALEGSGMVPSPFPSYSLFLSPSFPHSLILCFSIICMSITLLSPIIGFLSSLYMFWWLIISHEHNPFGFSWLQFTLMTLLLHVSYFRSKREGLFA